MTNETRDPFRDEEAKEATPTAGKTAGRARDLRVAAIGSLVAGGLMFAGIVGPLAVNAASPRLNTSGTPTTKTDDRSTTTDKSGKTDDRSSTSDKAGKDVKSSTDTSATTDDRSSTSDKAGKVGTDVQSSTDRAGTDVQSSTDRAGTDVQSSTDRAGTDVQSSTDSTSALR
jgi:hypothetical protein